MKTANVPKHAVAEALSKRATARNMQQSTLIEVLNLNKAIIA